MYIYKITKTVNNKCYIGQTTCEGNARWNGHRCDLRKGRHSNSHLQNAWNKYGEEAFTYRVIDSLVSPSQRAIDMLECRHILLNPDNYNIRDGGGRGKMSEDSRAKMRESAKNKPPVSDETRHRLSLSGKGNKSRTGQTISDAQKVKMSAKLKGKTFSPEYRAKLSEKAKRKWTPERIAKKVATQRANKLKATQN